MCPATVLIVDDDPTTRKLVRVSLATAGYLVAEAEGVESALRIATTEPPALVILDIGLPDGTGLDVCRRLRALPATAAVPIVAVSGWEARLAAARAEGLFTDCLLKPVEPSRLLQVVAPHLPARVRAQPRGSPEVLLVDDDPQQRKLVKLCLEQAGYRVSAVSHGADALDHAWRMRPDAIVSDLLMPDLDGFQLCHALREDPRLAHVPIVLISADFTEPGDQALGQAIGATACITRTPDMQELVAALDAALRDPQPPAPTPAEIPQAPYTASLTRRIDRQRAWQRLAERLIACQAAQLGVLGRLGTDLRDADAAEELIDDLLYRTLEAAQVAHGAAYLRGNDGRLALRAQVGFAEWAHGLVATGLDHADWLLTTAQAGEPVVLPHNAAAQDEAGDLLLRAGGRSLLAVPLGAGPLALGVVVLVAADDSLDAAALPVGAALGTQLWQSIELVRAHAALREARASLVQAKLQEGQLDGIVLAARELAHLVNNALAGPVGVLDLLMNQGAVPDAWQDLVRDAAADLQAAAGHVAQLHNVVRIQTRETPAGPALDLVRSTAPAAVEPPDSPESAGAV